MDILNRSFTDKLPKLLKQQLADLFTDFQLDSWRLFAGSQTVLSLRFNNTFDVHMENMQNDQTYRRKSPSDINRDTLRKQIHFSKKHHGSCSYDTPTHLSQAQVSTDSGIQLLTESDANFTQNYNSPPTPGTNPDAEPFNPASIWQRKSVHNRGYVSSVTEPSVVIPSVKDNESQTHGTSKDIMTQCTTDMMSSALDDMPLSMEITSSKRHTKGEMVLTHHGHKPQTTVAVVQRPLTQAAVHCDMKSLTTDMTEDSPAVSDPESPRKSTKSHEASGSDQLTQVEMNMIYKAITEMTDDLQKGITCSEKWPT